MRDGEAERLALEALVDNAGADAGRGPALVEADRGLMVTFLARVAGIAIGWYVNRSNVKDRSIVPS
jgi:hypothetical protein